MKDILERDFKKGLEKKKTSDIQGALCIFSTLASKEYLSSIKEIVKIFNQLGMKRELEHLLNLNWLDKFDNIKEDIKSIINKKKVIAIHQPDYIPWLGWFHKVFYADEICILDNSQWNKASYYRRTNIRHPSKDIRKLTIPIKKCSDYENQVNIICTDEKWRRNHLNLIKETYRKYPYFDKEFPEFENLIIETKNTNKVNEINLLIIKRILKYLSISTPIILSSELDIESKKNDRNIDIVKSLKGNAYYSGSQAREYNDINSFENNKISLFYQDFYSYMSYIGNNLKSFMNGLSIIDLLFIYGRDNVIKFLKGSVEFNLRIFTEKNLKYSS